DLIEDQSKGVSWLRFASRTSAIENRDASPPLTSSPPPPSPARPAARRTSNYQGQTYNSADSVKEFFARQGKKIDAADFEARAARQDLKSERACVMQNMAWG